MSNQAYALPGYRPALCTDNQPHPLQPSAKPASTMAQAQPRSMSPSRSEPLSVQTSAKSAPGIKAQRESATASGRHAAQSSFPIVILCRLCLHVFSHLVNMTMQCRTASASRTILQTETCPEELQRPAGQPWYSPRHCNLCSPHHG